MPAILPHVRLDRSARLPKYFMPHQIAWIEGEHDLHCQGKQVMALAEKSIRIGWTYCDAFKNVRKRLHFPNRDYLFVSKDYPSAIEYIRLAYRFAEFFNFTRTIISRGQEHLKVPRLDPDGRPTAFTDEIKVGVIKFDNGSRILAFSSHPQAMAVYGGDVGIDEFAKHPNAKLLWETAQGRVALGHDLAIWSAHDGADTLFAKFAEQARSVAVAVSAAVEPGVPPGGINASSASNATAEPNLQLSSIQQSINPSIHQSLSTVPSSPWNLYFRVTMPDALDLGLLDLINRTRATPLTKDDFLANCRARAGLHEIYEQSYLCNPVPPGASIVEWPVIQKCALDYEIHRVHLEQQDVIDQFGDFCPSRDRSREDKIQNFLHERFSSIFVKRSTYRLGFDVAASGSGDLAAIYIDELKGSDLWLRALFTCRTDDWHFLETVLFTFLRLRTVHAAGDATGIGRQICWKAAQRFPWAFASVNFRSAKHDLAFALMNQLANAEKRFPKNARDIAADFFALRKQFRGGTWVFSEGRNLLNPASHCDIAWAGALSSHAHLTHVAPQVRAVVG